MLLAVVWLGCGAASTVAVLSLSTRVFVNNGNRLSIHGSLLDNLLPATMSKRKAGADGQAKRARSEGPSDLEYVPGFGNHLDSEALKGALPKGQNNPQKVR